MTEAKICPKCGTPQQWEMWRYCHCGYDYGPVELREMQPEEVRHKQETDHKQSHTGTFVCDHPERLLVLAFCGLVLIAWLSNGIDSLHWLTNAAAAVAFVLYMFPFTIMKKLRSK